jgi:hypothetical protein
MYVKNIFIQHQLYNRPDARQTLPEFEVSKPTNRNGPTAIRRGWR